MSGVIKSASRVVAAHGAPRGHSHVVCSLATGTFAELLDIAAPTFDAWAREQGYDLVLSTEHLDAARHPSWSKLALVEELLEQYEVVIWLDADTVVVRFDEPMPEPGEGQVIALSHHHQAHDRAHPVANAGVFAIRRGADATALLAAWRADPERLQDHNWWENAAFLRLLGHSLEPPFEVIEPSPWVSKVRSLDLRWNSVPGYCEARDPVIVHHARAEHGDNQRRIEGMSVDAAVALASRNGADQLAAFAAATHGGGLRIAIVAGVLVERDAISAAAANRAAMLATMPGVASVHVFAQHIDRPLDVSGYEVRDAWALYCHPRFQQADIAIFHWGIHNELADALALLVGRDRPRPIVHFHNFTPRELLPPDQHALIDKSLLQLNALVELGVPFWTESEFNASVVRELGASDRDIAFVPFPLSLPTEGTTSSEPGLRLLSVGRFVAAKHPETVVSALALVAPQLDREVRLQLIGSARFSDAGYLDRLRRQAADLGVADLVDFEVNATEAELHAAYSSADVLISASAHEGLCVPVLEAYAAGCRVIGTDAGNLPYIVVPPDVCTPVGDAPALAAAIMQYAGDPPTTDPERAARVGALLERYSDRSAREAMGRQLARWVTAHPT